MSNKWDEFIETPSNKFGYEVPVFTPSIYREFRGEIFTTFHSEEHPVMRHIHYEKSELSIHGRFSKSYKGVLRGLHYQLAPAAQTKLVRVIKGKVLDVAVDIRAGSPSFGQHVSVELSEQNKRQLLVPRGFAHAFVVLEDDTVFAYKVDNYYSPENDRGIAFDDPALGINWIVAKDSLKLSVKDTQQVALANAEVFAFEQDYYA